MSLENKRSRSGADFGRPSTSFAAASDRTKRRKTEKMRSEFGTEELAYATQMNLRADGKLDAAKVVYDVTAGSPSKALSYRSSLGQVGERTLMPDEALAIFVEGNFSKKQYETIRSGCKSANSKVYPPYYVIQKAKEECYPPKNSIKVTETCGAVKLQDLLNHTAERILITQSDVLLKLDTDNLKHMKLICKWGCDGTSGQSTFKQKFFDDDGTKTDENIFFTSLVPLQLYNEKSNEKTVIWKNPRPSSPRFCRPIKIEFMRETAETTKAEVEYVTEQQKNLVPYCTFIRGKSMTVTFELSLTMVDGKVCNSLSDNASTQRCYLCKATSKEFNDLDKIVKREVIEENLQFGISSLHAWIRCFECCLHLSYKLDVKKWQVRDAKEKEIVKSRKLATQDAFRKKLGLIVDKPKQAFGSSNDGNTARRFFANASISSNITNVDEQLIQRFHVILQVISSGHEIDISKFKTYTFQTGKLFVQLYPWYYMPTSVHKLLIHGPQIVASALLPIGLMSEEAQESCNKYIKKFRQDFTRKTSRTSTMEDLIHRLLLTSDPHISSIRKLLGKSKNSLSDDAIELLLAPQFSTDDDEISGDESNVTDFVDSD